MQIRAEHAALVDLARRIDVHTSGLSLPGDERSLIPIGCLDVAIEHQAAIALLHSSKLYGLSFALPRVLSEAPARGLWLHACASEEELAKFKKGRIDQKFATLI